LKRTTETWHRFWRLTGFERGVALEAAVALVATWFGLRAAGFRRWHATLAWLAPSPAAYDTKQDSISSARAIARMEQSAANHLFFRANCLEQSLTLWWLLHRRGIAAELRIGARKDAGRFEAHAWVESSGVVLNDTSESHLHFVPFDGRVSAMETQIR
jgi:hypothetical protein